MTDGNVVLSALLGVGLAGSTIAWSIVSMRRAMSAPGARFVAIIFRGMALRMFTMLAALIVVFLVFPVQPVAFAGSFLIVAVIGLVIEIRALLRIGKTRDESRDPKESEV